MLGIIYYSEQQIKRVRVVRRADGYYCQFLIDVERQEYHKPTGQITGIDLGLKEFYTDAQGNTVENPRYLSKSEKRLKKAQVRRAVVEGLSEIKTLDSYKYTSSEENFLRIDFESQYESKSTLLHKII